MVSHINFSQKFYIIWLIEIKFKGDFGMKRTNCKCSERRGLACPIPWGTVLKHSSKVVEGRDLVL